MAQGGPERRGLFKIKKMKCLPHKKVVHCTGEKVKANFCLLIIICPVSKEIST